MAPDARGKVRIILRWYKSGEYVEQPVEPVVLDEREKAIVKKRK
jgi:hypothetical protein